MKKLFLIALASLAIVSCRDESTPEQIKKVSVETQNSYDDQAATKFLETHYLDAKGNIKEWKETDAAQVKLSALNPVKLPSGVIYVVRVGVQPEPGTTIGTTDVISLMTNATTYLATETDGKVAYNSQFAFKNTIAGTGVPETDPAFYYVKESVLTKATTDAAKQRSYYEIEGFREALQKFKAFNIPASDNYNLQGVIIVPSRAAFARDAHFNYTGVSLNDRSFVFNFQVYSSRARGANEN